MADIVINLIVSVIIFAFGYLFNTGYRYLIFTKPTANLWGKIMNAKSPTIIVTPLHSLSDIVERNEYVSTLSLPEAFALSELLQTANELKRSGIIKTIPDIDTAMHVRATQRMSHNLICIGGSEANDISRMIFAQYDLPYHDSRDNDGFEHKFDHSKSICPEFYDERLCVDFGLLIVINNPYYVDNNYRKICIFAGCYAFGSAAATKLVSPRFARKTMTVIKKEWSEFIIVVKAHVDGDFVGDPVIVDSFELNDQSRRSNQS